MYLISEFYNSHRYLIAEMIAFVLTFPLVSCLSMAVCHSGIKKRKNTLVNQYKIESYFDNIDIYFISEKTLASIENLYAELRIEVEKNIKKYPKESSFILSKNHTTEKQLFPNLYRNVEVAQSIVNIPDEISNNKMKSKVISTNVAKPKSEPNVPLSKPSDVVPKKVQEANWQEVNARFFNEKEQLSTDYAQVVSSQDGKSVCFHLVGGKVLRFPLESNSSVKVDDYLDIRKILLVELKYVGNNLQQQGKRILRIRAIEAMPKSEMVTDRINFSEEQKFAINIKSGHHLVLAPPGCGKTHVLAERVVQAIDDGVNVEDMACLTFTNRASREMKNRIHERTGNDVLDKLFVGNVHHFCSSILRKYNVISQCSTIVDDEEKSVILRTIVKRLYAKDVKDVEQYYNFQHYRYQVEHNHPTDLIVRPEMQEHISDMRYERVAREYEAYKKKYDLLDFEDFLLKGYDYLHDNKDIIKKYKWVQVDEVQDLNHLQIAIIDLVISPDSSCVVYLGDEQQAIYSFMGAKLSTLERLKNVCRGNIHHFQGNYRSPQYLLDVFNEYAEQNLHISRELLPCAKGEHANRGKDEDSLLLESCYYKEGPQRGDYCSYDMAADRALQYTEGRTAILANSNKEIDIISEKLTKKCVEHFKISGQDFLWSKEVKLLFAHFNAFCQSENLMTWARVLLGIGVMPSIEKAHEFIASANEAFLLGSDLLNEKRKTMIKDFIRDYASEFIIFDTETTGLDVNNDDIVEISALKISGGCIVDEFDIMLETGKQIPVMLGDIKNPIPEVYAQREKLARRDGLDNFMKWVGSMPVLAHNANFDIQILNANLKRDCDISDLDKRWARIYDSLEIARIVEPGLSSYKLKDLIAKFGLSGINSHLAIDDVKATKSLVDHLFKKASPIFIKQNEFFAKNQSVIDNLRNKYGELYKHTESLLSVPSSEDNIFVSEFEFAYQYFIKEGIMKEMEKMEFLVSFLKNDFMTDVSGKSLYQVIDEYMMPLNTLREADLCDGKSLQKRISIFVSTIHCAKGLEFDNVIVTGVQDGIFPFYKANDILRSSSNQQERQKAKQDVEESARKLYVAISRAKKRLCIQYPSNNSGYGQYGWFCFATRVSPFVNCISQYFRSISNS